METKRCTYCHKLQRAESRMCSRCGRSFERRSSRGGRSWHSSISVYSLPAASPHHVGHYSGLHPEDQPYQSNQMVTPQRFLQDMLEKESLSQEPESIILPSTRPTQHAVNRHRDSSRPTRRRKIPPRRSRPYLAAENTLSGNEEIPGTNGKDIRRRQISRPFVQEVLTPAPQHIDPLEEIEQLEDSNTTKNGEASLESTIQEIDSELVPQLPLEEQSFPATNDTPLLPEELPSYMQEALHTKQWPSPLMSIVLVAVGFCVLLATSISVLVAMNNHPVSLHEQVSITPPPKESTAQANPPKMPHLRLSTTQATFGSAASGIISSQTIILENSGDGQIVWQGNSDQLWLTTSPESGTFVESENIQITVNRGGLAPGKHEGHLTFVLPGQEDTPAVLNVTMTVTSIPAQLSVSTTSLSYTTAQSQAPDSQVLTIRNTGGQTLRWDATVSTGDGLPWLTLSLSHGVLPLGVGQALTVQVASQTLPIGTYIGWISFTGDDNAQVEVSLTVVAPANLAISPASLSFTSQQTEQTLSLQNSGDLSLDWSAQSSTNDGGNWLSLTPASGTLVPGQSATVTVHTNPSSLAPGSYQGTLTFSVANQTKQVSVSLVVTETQPTPTPTP